MTQVVVVAESVEDFSPVIQLCRIHRALRPCVGTGGLSLAFKIIHSPEVTLPLLCRAGIHPEKAMLSALPAFEGFVEDHASELVGIGEVGLDYSPHVVGSTDPV